MCPLLARPGGSVFLPSGEECTICIFVAGIIFLPPSSSDFLPGAGWVHLLLAGCVPRETVDFCCDSDVLFMATTLVETNGQTALELFPLCPSKGFLECSPQVGFQHVNNRRMHDLPSLPHSCPSYTGFWFRCPLG